MKIVCDACAAKYSIADEKVAGKVFKIRCKKCSNIIVVRGNADEASAAPTDDPQPNKDTKVFDYNGYDSPQDAMAAEGEWHVVIDQEQVGPMTAAEVRQRFASGEIDSETYIWKEGFADWERVPDVADFADLGSAAAPGDDGGGMFGAAPAAAMSAQPSADLFGGSGGGASGDDLFGSAGASGGSDLFGASDAVGDNTGEIPMSKEAEAQLKGQRNENSVLFSLGNLAALASDSPKAAPAAVSSSKSNVPNTGGSEGSGLIDIRSMASVYLADKGGAGPTSTPAGSADDLPVFSQSAFESASPVLLPTHSTGPDKKLLYTLVGVIAALVVAAVVLVIVVLKGDDKPSALAANSVAESADAVDSATTEEPAEGDTPTATEEPTEEVDEPTESETDPAENNLTAEAAKVDDKDKDNDKSKSSDRSRDKSKSRDRTPDRTPKPEPKAEPAESKGGCDEVTCLVDPGKACCKKYNSSSKSSSSSSSSKNSGLPEMLSKSDISSGIKGIKGRANSCGDKHGGKGTVKVRMVISGSGKVQSADASGGSAPLRSCVASAVKGAKFKKTQEGRTVTYPFIFR